MRLYEVRLAVNRGRAGGGGRTSDGNEEEIARDEDVRREEEIVSLEPGAPIGTHVPACGGPKR